MQRVRARNKHTPDATGGNRSCHQCAARCQFDSGPTNRPRKSRPPAHWPTRLTTAVLPLIGNAAQLADRQAESAEALLNAQDLWVPTVVIAREAQAMLQAAGVAEVRVATQVRAVPGIENRERTFTMHNWYQPVKDWFGQDTSPFQYAEPEVRPGEFVLEVGLGNYEVMTDTIFVMVYTKLVDPVTGATLAKERKYKYPTVGKTEPLFRGDAGGFKTTFTDTARPMVRESLREMKLLPSR